MESEEVQAALMRHWSASAVGNLEAEHDIYEENVICDYPQSGERIVGRPNLEAGRLVSRSNASLGKVMFGSRNTASTTRTAPRTP
jgi:hypothetical protein